MKRLSHNERTAGQALADLGATERRGTTVRMVVVTAPVDQLNRFKAERALESLADRGLVETIGPRGDRTYSLTATGVARFPVRSADPYARQLHDLADKLRRRPATQVAT